MMLETSKKSLVIVGLLGLLGIFLSHNLLMNKYVGKTPTGRVWESVNSLTRWIGIREKKPMFVLFTTWIELAHKRQINDNVLRLWRVWQPEILPLLFTEQESERKRAESFGWRALPPTTFSCKGKLPILRDLYQVAMAEYPDTQLFGFANGDLLFGAGLYETMKVISRDPMTREEPLLVVARRLNVNFANRSDVHRLDEVPEILRHASEFQDGSSDAFFTNRLFPWHRIPDIVPGKLGVAMFLVSTARTLNIKVIDISPSVNVIHMVSSFGLPESARSENSYCNRFLIQKLGMTPSHWSCGSIFCSSMTTETNYGAVRVVKKTTTLPPNCNNCTQNLTYFQTQHTPDV